MVFDLFLPYVVVAAIAGAGIEWHPDVVAAAIAAGWGLDASGYAAPIALLGRSH